MLGLIIFDGPEVKKYSKNLLVLPLRVKKSNNHCYSMKSNDYRDSNQEKKQRTDAKNKAM